MKPAGALTMVAMLITVALSPQGAPALAQDPIPTAAETTPPSAPVSPAAASPAATPIVPATPDAASLPDLVARHAEPGEPAGQLRCLAGAIYFEAKGETLAGQLAVARVIIGRAGSGRFPASYCGVVYQRSQFAFVHDGAMPTIRTGSGSWRQAVAIARIADANSWHSEAEGALYFHAARVAPNWKRVRIARVDDHVFYR